MDDMVGEVATGMYINARGYRSKSEDLQVRDSEGCAPVFYFVFFCAFLCFSVRAAFASRGKTS
jgi:hypothetical protein